MEGTVLSTHARLKWVTFLVEESEVFRQGAEHMEYF